MAPMKKKSLHRLSSLFKSSNEEQSPPLLPTNTPPVPPKDNDQRPRPVSQQLPLRPADGNVGWNAGHQRAASAQLQPPPVNYGRTNGQYPRKAISSDRLRPTTPGSRPTSSGLKVSPSTPNLLPNRSAPSSPYLHPAGSTPNLNRYSGSAASSRPGTGSSTLSAQPPASSAVYAAALDGTADTDGGNKIKRRSGLFGGKKHKKEEEQRPVAWICGKEIIPYDTNPLLNGQRINELWDENGDCFIYLFPKQTNNGPSFKVDSQIFSSSAKLTKWAFGNIYSMPAAAQSNAMIAQEASQVSTRRHISLDSGKALGASRGPGTPPLSASSGASYTNGSDDGHDYRRLDPLDASQPIHLYLPLNLSDKAKDSGIKYPSSIPASDLEVLISARNLFAFLIGQSLIATRNRPSFYHIFLGIAQALTFYEFSNLDGSTFGEVAHYNFDMNVRELRLNDVRASREKTIEGIVLGEAMRSVMLYNEAFTHAVGRLAEIKSIKSNKYTMISNRTVDLLDRGAIDLGHRIETMQQKLTDFQFYGLFQGTLNSTSSLESKQLNFDRWKSAYSAMRRWFMNYQKAKWGNWPPKVSKKKNHIAISTDGLNRIVLKDLYADICLLYDLLVDRTALTTRSGDLVEQLKDDMIDIVPRTIRKILAECDHSTPPVLPPVPFDVPILPKVASKADIHAKLKKHDLTPILTKSYNPDTNSREPTPPILHSFRLFDFDSAQGLNIQQIGDLRAGQWLFLYAVLQTLPLLVIDAPALEYTAGVEYFLCVAPRSGVPWAREDPMMNRNWYGVAGSDKIVSLPSDLLTHGVEGTYRRSHCWVRAQEWTESNSMLKAAAAETLAAPLPPPPGAPLAAASVGRSSSPDSVGGAERRKRASVVDLGLEALPLPAGVAPELPDSPVRSRPASSYGDPKTTFDAILGSVPTPEKGKRRR